MPKHQFRNEKPKTFEILPAGDYVLEVVSADSELSQGAKTRGADVLKIKFKSVEHGTEFEDKLIFHPSCDWKVDLFVNCFGFNPQVGESVNLDPENLVGRRGWCKVNIRTFERQDKTKGQANEIAVFYTDKEKFPRNVIDAADVPVAAAAPGNDPWNI